MGEVAVFSTEELPLHNHTSNKTIKSPDQALHIITIAANIDEQSHVEVNPQEGWLPITESRNGNFWTSVCHLLSSGIGGFQALLLPVAFASLGWSWGLICLSLAFAWQLYTIWLLVQLHETVSGTRYSRYLQLAMVAFGPKLGKLLALFPVMYLSGGTCVMLIITGGTTMKQFLEMMCGDSSTCHSKLLTGTEWFLVFTSMAIIMAQPPNLNSVAGFSLLGAVTGITYCTLIWIFSISKVRPNGVSYDTLQEEKSNMARMSSVLNAIGIIVLAFKGHNLVLEIQGTLPSSRKHPSRKPMWRAVIVSCILIAVCLFTVAIAGFWAYGNKIPKNGGILSAFLQLHGHNTSKVVKGLIYLLIVTNCLSSFQIYAMPVFDNLELRYTSIKKQPCSRWVRTSLRLFFGALAFFISVTFPFLPSLAALIGGIALPLTLVYPCFMWISIKKPRRSSLMYCVNLGLGCLGIVLSVLLVVAAIWNLATKGLNANFFKP